MLVLGIAVKRAVVSVVLIALVLIVALAELAPCSRLVDVEMAPLVNLLSSQLGHLSALRCFLFAKPRSMPLMPPSAGRDFGLATHRMNARYISSIWLLVVRRHWSMVECESYLHGEPGIRQTPRNQPHLGGCFQTIFSPIGTACRAYGLRRDRP